MPCTWVSQLQSWCSVNNPKILTFPAGNCAVLFDKRSCVIIAPAIGLATFPSPTDGAPGRAASSQNDNRAFFSGEISAVPHSTLAKRSQRAGWKHSLLVGLGQCFLMALNIRNMAGGHLLFLFFNTILNTYVWVYIVRTVMHSKKHEVFSYAMGSAVGAVFGVLVSVHYVRPNALTHLSASTLPTPDFLSTVMAIILHVVK